MKTDCQLPAWGEIGLRLLVEAVRRDEASDWPLRESRSFLGARRWVDALYHRRVDGHAQRIYEHVWYLNRRALDELLCAPGMPSAPVVLLKGADFVSRFGGGVPIGTRIDTDILVPRQSLGQFKKALCRLGYVVGSFSETLNTIVEWDALEEARMESTHRELAPRCRLVRLELADEDEAYLDSHPAEFSTAPLYRIKNAWHTLVEFDVHHTFAEGVDSKGLLERSVEGPFERARALSVADSIWSTCMKYYGEATIGEFEDALYFFYLARMCEEPSIDWSLIVEMAEENRCEAGVYYWLSFVESISGGGVPREVIAQLRRARDTRDAWDTFDAGWQLAKLFGGVERMPVRFSDSGEC